MNKENDSFKDFVLDQLTGIEDVLCKRMFGGYGLYGAEFFFGIIADSRLYFKTTENTRKKYQEAGMKPFKATPKQTLKNYFEVPVEILEASDELVDWALESIKISSEAEASR